MWLKAPGLLALVIWATWKTSTEPSASSWRVRDVSVQNVAAVAPPTLVKQKCFLSSVAVVTGSQWEAVLPVVDHSGAVFSSALVLHHGDQVKGAADGSVWVWPGGGAVALHLQHRVVLQEQKVQVCSLGGAQAGAGVPWWTPAGSGGPPAGPRWPDRRAPGSAESP